MFESFSQKYFKQYNNMVDVIAGDANAAACKFYKRQEYQDLYNSSVAVRFQRNITGDQQAPPISEQTSSLLFRPIITILSFIQQIISVVASWLFSHGETRLDQEL